MLFGSLVAAFYSFNVAFNISFNVALLFLFVFYLLTTIFVVLFRDYQVFRLPFAYLALVFLRLLRLLRVCVR